MAKRPGWEDALARSGLMETLAAFDPQVAGTLPLGVATPDSDIDIDIDILAHAPDAHAVSTVLIERHGHEAGFVIRQWTTADRPVIAGFVAHEWRVAELLRVYDQVEGPPLGGGNAPARLVPLTPKAMERWSSHRS